MNVIKFIHLNQKPGRIEFVCQTSEGENISEYDIYFELEPDVFPSKDAIAAAMAAMAGQKYEEIYFDFEISQDAKKDIGAFTKAEIYSEFFSVKNKSNIGNNIILNFSGGFDSLAAYCLMPEDTKLVAVDWGGWFTREQNFFQRFTPYTLRTNLRELKFDRNSWTFMCIGAILYCEYLNAGYNVMGTIFEATPYHFFENPTAAYTNITMPFSITGLKDIRYTNGLTEVGTSIVVSHYVPEILNDSLISLSNSKTEKRYRKEILLDIVCEKYHRQVKFDRTPAPDKKVKWGTNLAVDFLCLYILKNRGLDEAQATVSDIPDEAVALVDQLELTFYERLNCDFVSGTTFPNNKLRADLMKKLLEAGVLPYNETDYRELRQVSDFLNLYHLFDEKRLDAKTECTNKKKTDMPQKSSESYFHKIISSVKHCFR